MKKPITCRNTDSGPFSEMFFVRAKFQLLEKNYFLLLFHIVVISAKILAAESFD